MTHVIDTLGQRLPSGRTIYLTFGELMRRMAQRHATDVIRIGRAGGNLIRITTPAGVAGIIVEAAIIGTLEYLDNTTPPLSQEELDLAAEIINQLDQSAESVFQQGAAYLDSNVTDGALSSTGHTGLENQDILDWAPDPAPVVRPTEINEIIITAERRPTGTLDFNINSTSTRLYGPESIRDIERTIDIPQHTQEIDFINTETVPASGTIEEIGVYPLSGTDRVTIVIDIPLDTVIPIDTSILDATETSIDTIPATTVTTVLTNEGMRVSVNVDTLIDAAVLEGSRPRKDTKPTGFWYVAALRFINRTWGRLTELDDFQSAVQRNMIFNQDTTICISQNECISIRRGQTFSEIPLEYKAQALTEIGQLTEDVSLDFEGTIEDLYKMELIDTTIALAQISERALINELGVQGILNYGNASTWLRRISAAADTFQGQITLGENTNAIQTN